MKKIKTAEAAGRILCHDQTAATAQGGASVLFKKGHTVREEDIEKLLCAGKSHIYIYEAAEGMLHEDEAAEILYRVCAGSGMEGTRPSEGKIEIIARGGGLLKVDAPRLLAINDLGNIVIATRRNNSVVKNGDKIAGVRVIPLVVSKCLLDEVEKTACGRPLLEIKPFCKLKTAVIVIGSELKCARVKDEFTPAIEQKLSLYNLKIDIRKVAGDDIEEVKSAIAECLDCGADLVLCTGGMSVDPDDITPAAIKAAGAEVVSYGVPVLPGSMLLAGYIKGAAIFGLPACAMYAKTTSFDLLLPRVLARDIVTRKEIASLGHGGLCLKCPSCVFPHCEFGKG